MAEATLTRDEVIDESLRHLRNKPHLRPELCIYCYELPNPFYRKEIRDVGLLHYCGHGGKIELCPLCNPDVRKLPSPWWK